MDNTNVKDEFFANRSLMSFCQACLSKDRALSSVTEHVDIFYKICDFHNVSPPTEGYLCWECVALLKKMRKFTKMVADAQEMLQTYYLSAQDRKKIFTDGSSTVLFTISQAQNPFPHSLSNLSITLHEPTTLICEAKVKLVKMELEPEIFHDNDNFEYATDDIKPDIKGDPDENLEVESDLDNAEIENESIDLLIVKKSPRKLEELNKKRNMNRQGKYRFINTELMKHRRYLMKKKTIGIEEAMSMLEEERRGSVFMSAEHKCVSCVEIMEKEEELLDHNKKCHDVSAGKFVCHVCQTRCTTANALRSHVSSHGACKQCRACAWRGVSSGVVREHVEEHHKMVQCIACRLLFKNVRLFYNHYKAMHTIFVCDVCGKRNKSRDKLVRHLRYHFGFICPFCNKKLKNISSYANHIECLHNESYPDNAYCVPCDRRFKNDRLYRRHWQNSSAHAKERDNSRVKRKYPCPECSNVYSRRAYLNNHFRHVHTKESKFYCEECDKHFLNRTRYTDHRRYKHEGLQRDKNKLCNICGRGFAANRTLINHIRTHSGERPFACSLCDAKFTQKHAMLSHVKYIHLKNKRKPTWHE